MILLDTIIPGGSVVLDTAKAAADSLTSVAEFFKQNGSDPFLNLSYAFAGSFIVNVLRVVGRKLSKTKLDAAPSNGWVDFLLLPLIGATLLSAYLFSGYEFRPLVSMHVGATAPLFFEQIANKLPNVPEGTKG
jgi:hypothetical protein